MIVALGLSFLLVSASIYPRTKGPKDSLLYFGSVSEMTLENFKRASMSRTEQEFLEDLVGQCHRNSEIVYGKFRALTWAYRLLLLSLPFWAITNSELREKTLSLGV